MDDHRIFDRHAVRLHRGRAARDPAPVASLMEDLADRLLDRLDDTTYRFTHALDIGGRGVVAPLLRARGIETISCDLSPTMAALSGAPCVCADEEFLPFGAGSFDLVVASFSLHWVNDLPGALAQIRHALKPDGLFIASIPVLPTLAPLREALAEAELALSGGVSPRVSPFPALRDCAGLLQRAGFALPVADLEVMDLRYRTPLALLRDLRAGGESNAVALRERRHTPGSVFAAALAALTPEDETPLAMPLHLAMLSGWAPAQSQPRPLKPGQFSVSLEEALNGAAGE